MFLSEAVAVNPAFINFISLYIIRTLFLKHILDSQWKNICSGYLVINPTTLCFFDHFFYCMARVQTEVQELYYGTSLNL